MTEGARLAKVDRKYKRNSDEEINTVRELYLIEGLSARLIERRTGISRHMVYDVVRGRRRPNTPLSGRMQEWLQAREAERPRPGGRDGLRALALAFAERKRIVIPGEQD